MTMKTDAYRFTSIRPEYFPDYDTHAVEMIDLTATGLPMVFTAEEAIALGHRLVEAGVGALKAEEKAPK